MNTPGIASHAGGARSAYPLFFDSLPGDWPEGSRACLYYDGGPGTPQDPSSRSLSRVRWITRTGDYRKCGVLDYEPGCPITYQNPVLVRWVQGRKVMNVRARVYCDRADASRAWGALTAVGLTEYPGLLWWIATLDGSQGRTPESLSTELHEQWNAPIPADRIWGHQWGSGATVDESDLFLPW